jgi:hemoglobin
MKKLLFYFNDMIQDWDEHLKKLTDFGEMNLFGGKMYKGDPLKARKLTNIWGKNRRTNLESG